MPVPVPVPVPVPDRWLFVRLPGDGHLSAAGNDEDRARAGGPSQLTIWRTRSTAQMATFRFRAGHGHGHGHGHGRVFGASRPAAFLDRLNDEGEIEAELLTDDDDLQARIRSNPGLRWKALNVKKHRGLDG